MDNKYKITIYDVNELTLKKVHYIKKVEIPSEIIGYKHIIPYILKLMYPDYFIIDQQNGNNNEWTGRPDYKLLNIKNKSDVFELEVKINRDSIRMTQFDYFVKNKNKTKIYIMFVEVDYREEQINYNSRESLSDVLFRLKKDKEEKDIANSLNKHFNF